MTATTSTPTDLPDHNGENVRAAKIKLGGLGTGFAGLDVAPIFIDLDEVRYFVVKARATASPSCERDKSSGSLYWLNRLTADTWAPAERAIVERILTEHAAEVEKRKADIDGQTSIDDELAAKDREDRDDTDSPTDIAKAAAERAKRGS